MKKLNAALLAALFVGSFALTSNVDANAQRFIVTPDNGWHDNWRNNDWHDNGWHYGWRHHHNFYRSYGWNNGWNDWRWRRLHADRDWRWRRGWY